MTTQIDVACAEAERRPLTVDISTTGRRSGLPRRIEIWVVAVGGQLYIGGTPRPRDWLANLRADPRLTLHFTGDPPGVNADVEATATEVTDLATRRAVWRHASTEWYRGQVPVGDLIASAPLVEVVLDR